MRNVISVFTALFIFLAAPLELAHSSVAVIPLQYSKDLKNVITVSPSGGDFSDPAAALASISDATPTNSYHVIIGPGVYTLTQPLVMKPHVSVAGSGPVTTLLSGAISTANESTSAIISGADDATLSGMTVKNYGGSVYSIAIYNSGSPIIHDVAATASGATNNYAVYNSSSSPVLYDTTVKGTGGDLAVGVFNMGSSPTMTDVTATGSGGNENEGMVCQNSSSPRVNNCTFTGSGGPFSYGVASISSDFTIRNSSIEGSTNGIYNGVGTLRVLRSSVTGGSTTAGGTLTCVISDNGESSAVGLNCI